VDGTAASAGVWWRAIESEISAAPWANWLEKDFTTFHCMTKEAKSTRHNGTKWECITKNTMKITDKMRAPTVEPQM